MTKKESLTKIRTHLELIIESYDRLPSGAKHESASNADIYAILCIIDNLIETLEKED